MTVVAVAQQIGPSLVRTPLPPNTIPQINPWNHICVQVIQYQAKHRQKLRMLSRVTLHCHVTTIALNICSQSLQNIDFHKIKYFLPRFISPLTQCSGAARCSSKENGLQISIFVYLNFSIFAYFHFSKYLTIWSSTKSLFLLYICIFPYL